jgi:hypothetical protein
MTSTQNEQKERLAIAQYVWKDRINEMGSNHKTMTVCRFMHFRACAVGGLGTIVVAALLAVATSNPSCAWNDKTHIAIAKAAGYENWYNVTGADMAKIKAGDIEAHNHYMDTPFGAIVTSEMVMDQAARYNQVDKDGHLYGAIIASLRDFIREREKGKVGAYHLAFCAHYVGDLSQPLHSMVFSAFNKRFHAAFDAIIEDEVLDNLDKIEIYPIKIDSEASLAREIARIATLSVSLGYELEAQGRLISKEEAYIQIGHSASLLKAILEYTKVKQ